MLASTGPGPVIDDSLDHALEVHYGAKLHRAEQQPFPRVVAKPPCSKRRRVPLYSNRSVLLRQPQPTHGRQAGAGQGCRRLRVSKYADQRGADVRSRRRRLHHSAAQCRPGRRNRHGQIASRRRRRAKLRPRRIGWALLHHRRSRSRPKAALAAKPGLPITSPASTSSSSMRSAICHSLMSKLKS